MTNKIVIAAIVIAVLVFVYKFFLSGPAVTDVDVEPAEFEELAGGSDVVILDVRSSFEFGGEKIKGAQNLSYTSASFKKTVETFDKSKTYLVYCASGSRSVGAVKILKGLGFEKVYNLSGGIEHWKKEGKPVVR